MRYFLGAGVLAVIGAVAVACGSSTSDSNPVTDAGSTVDSGGTVDSGSLDSGGDGDAACSPEPDQSGHAQAIAEAVCAPHAGCCTQIGLGFDTTACVQELAPRYQVFFDGARCRGGQYVPSAVAECIAALEAYAGSCPMNYGTGDLGELYHRADRACAAIFDGISEPGEPCSSDLDCVQTAGSVTECDSGQCIRTVWGQEGSSCDSSAQPIATDCDKYDGLICRNDVCTKLGEAGESCQSPAHCAPDTKCVQGSCEPRKALGEACNDDCMPELECVNGICGGTLGDPCTSGSECASGQCNAGKCGPYNHLVDLFTSQSCQ